MRYLRHVSQTFEGGTVFTQALGFGINIDCDSVVCVHHSTNKHTPVLKMNEPYRYGMPPFNNSPVAQWLMWTACTGRSWPARH
jgi:hypothetical protein